MRFLISGVLGLLLAAGTIYAVVSYSGDDKADKVKLEQAGLYNYGTR